MTTAGILLRSAVVASALCVLSACAVAGPADERAASDNVALPPTTGVFDYQLGGADDTVFGGGTSADIDVVVRDSTFDPLVGSYSVCYVNGFQTQPDADTAWADHPEAILRDSAGEPIVDPDWPDEHILDPSSREQRKKILAVVGKVIDGCADAGFDAVEIDNLDTWTRFESIDESGARELARDYVDRSHARGMAIAQKNAAEITAAAHDDLGFDFAVTEECAAFDECSAFTGEYDGHVLEIEYPDSLAEAGLTFADVCELGDRAALTILRDRELVRADEAGYVYEKC